ncbi:MAG: DUF2997 domain-containing protein [Anaerolineae bacterium]|nr:DUF2997 domain-containing protein [Anaerolineae bacterium]
MDVQEIEVVIDKNGQVNIQVRGVKGTACLDITREMEEALGNLVQERIMAPGISDLSLPDSESIERENRIHRKLK